MGPVCIDCLVPCECFPDQHLCYRWEIKVIDADWAAYVETDIDVPTADEEDDMDEGGLPL